LQRERKKKDEKRMQQLEVKRAQEEETCTFQPETRGCPEFIKRIAESMKEAGVKKESNALDAAIRWKF
jgi:hypothetical protein